MPTPLAAIADVVVAEIVVSGALRDGSWLQRDGVVFVADDLAEEAKRLWPTAKCGEAHGRDKWPWVLDLDAR